MFISTFLTGKYLFLERYLKIYSLYNDIILFYSILNMKAIFCLEIINSK